MDERAILAAFDERVRRDPVPDGPDTRVERASEVVRLVSGSGGWTGVVWSDLGAADADAVIAAQIERFARLGVPWEWKHYSHDAPRDLPERLVEAGFTPGPPEALMFADTREVATGIQPPAGVELLPVTDRSGVESLVRVHDEVFGGDNAAMGERLLARIARDGTGAGGVTGGVTAVVAMAGDTPVGGGRLELGVGTPFASLWGGGTVPAWRGRGVFRAMVAHRARLAAEAGFRFLHVDASAASQPILRRGGFVAVATTTPFTHAGRRR